MHRLTLALLTVPALAKLCSRPGAPKGVPCDGCESTAPAAAA